MTKRIAFFSIPAHGHTNPTLEVVRSLTRRGHEVRYYAFEMTREKIEAAGAAFIPCDAYLPPQPRDFERRAKYDFSSLIGMATHVTLGMEAAVCAELAAFAPHCIVADSMCLWGKLYAQKLGIPMICSTTSFAYNEHTARLMKPGFREVLYTLGGIPRMNRYMEQLRQGGYAVQGIEALIGNDDHTETIVYTSRAFQPMNETFGETYTFVGPSIPEHVVETGRRDRPLIYVSLGTVIRDVDFFKVCIKALKDMPLDVILSVGDAKNASLLRDAPESFQVRASVAQLKVLQNADVFITHCGMNSVNESLYFEVPMVMFPQHSEQRAVAMRALEVGAGVMPRRARPRDIRDAVDRILEDPAKYRERIHVISQSFRRAGGPERAADRIERFMRGA